KVRTAVKDIAADLVKLYAARQAKQGYRYLPDTVWQKEFEEEFEFEETDDQLRAIEDVKADMESGRIMDRLICGDVGFGKTEVAIRAAFKAVQEGKQVAFLVPTTILAQQHYNTFLHRMSNYPVTVKMLSRFVSAGEQKKIVADLKKGMVDIVVGTHRLLSKDIVFKDLGLLIIDEEQRFGVSHKEKIKQLRKDVDVLTLSATPIPRTLHMSLAGIRDMSLLTEPPIDRVPIQTYVMEYSEDAVREAILREARRGGQVYYVYNLTNNIDMIAAKIQDMVPDLKVAYAHGKMSSRELENIMEDFVAGDIDVLVSTTIIETGMDISNVNTIIVHDADRFGLSQLYQLRGRVGRSDRTAYAFLMYRKDKILAEIAENRLKAIREFSDLGSGIRIAMRDLEIRGAGNVLGAEQSGHMEAVGYELYCKLLNEAVSLLKGEYVLGDYDTTIDLSIDGFIPADYIKNEYEKLNMYKKISAIVNEEDQEDIRSELEDRFGPIPQVTENLLEVALMKAKAHEVFITEISGGKSEFKISIYKLAPVDTYKIHWFLKSYNEETQPGKRRVIGESNQSTLRFVAEANPYFVFRPKHVPKTVPEIKKTLLNFFDNLREIIRKEGEEDA
ncbi:MAG: transcription-repair coupling factor, partial [Lachnospiraceae bacterium]|nr:transcription-repair coupling factor [Lachnospiraceae bacterium]